MTNKILRTALVLGATGLVGRELVDQLLADDYYSKVKVFVRRSTGIKNTKLIEHIIDFDNPEDWANELVGDVIYSAFGTTLKTAGSKDAQYKVDYRYQYLVLRLAFENAVPDCVLVSSPGASIASKFFYYRMKGELDRDVAKLGFDRLVLIKPSFLWGKREKTRFGESFGIAVGNMLSWIPGIRKYRPIKGSIVARAMIHSIKSPGDHPITQYTADQLFKMKS